MKNFRQQNMKSIVNTSVHTATSLVTLGLLGTLVITGCNQKPADNGKVTESHESAEHSHDKHKHNHQNDESHDAHEGHEHKEHENNHEHNHEGEHSHEHHDHDDKKNVKDIKHIGKHVHGEAELHAIVDGNALILELNSPAMNIFGFEHQPSTDEQKTTVETQEKRLKDASKLFNIDGGDCAMADVDVDMPFENDHKHAEHTEEHAHKDEEHKHEEHHHKDGSVHSDVKATYNFTCKDSKNIKGITINVFSTFTGFTKLNTKWIKADKQGATTLTKDSYTISFK